MKPRMAIPIALATLTFVCSTPACRAQTGAGEAPSSLGSGGGEQQKLALTPAQRRAIYATVGNDKSKSAKPQFAARVGADVPPMIELYTLPERVLAENEAAKLYEYTIVQDKVVVVDPTRMRVIDVIGPPQE